MISERPICRCDLVIIVGYIYSSVYREIGGRGFYYIPLVGPSSPYTLRAKS